MQTKFIFVTGGVMSGLGKGVVSASISKLLQLSDQKVSCVKIDPYLNFDAGTMNPIAHGEVFVTEDVTNTSPWAIGFIVPASKFRYGSIFTHETF